MGRCREKIGRYQGNEDERSRHNIYIHAGLRQRGGAEVPSPVTDREVGVVDTCAGEGV